VVVEASANDLTLPLLNKNGMVVGAGGSTIPPIFQNIKTLVKSRLESNQKNSSPTSSSKMTDGSKSRIH